MKFRKLSAVRIKPAAWPPNPLLPEPVRQHVQSDGLPGAVFKSKGKRPWREVGKAGTFTQHPTDAHVDRMESGYLKLVNGLRHRHARNPASAIKGVQAIRAKALNLRGRIEAILAMLPKKTAKRDRATAIIAACWRDTRNMKKLPSRSTVQRILRVIDGGV
jgi:hypothetical protein